MTRDEQRRIRVTNMVLLEEKEDELRCYRMKAKSMKDCWNVLGQVITGRMQGYVPTKEVDNYPSQEDVRSLVNDITRLTREIEELNQLLHGNTVRNISPDD